MNILIPDAIFDDGHPIETAAAEPYELQVEHARTPGELSDSVWDGADAIVGNNLMPFGQDVADRASNARILVRVGVGIDNVDLAVWAEREIPVCNVPDYGTGEVADHAMALVLALLRGTAVYERRLADLEGDVFDRLPVPDSMRRLSGQNALIVGFGAIGRAFADRAKAFGMAVGFYDPDIVPGTWDATAFHRFSSLTDALASADIVSLHVPLNETTANLFDARRIAEMKADAVLINTARGGLVDTEAVAKALKAGRLGGAGLDVFPAEPLATSDTLLTAVRQRAEWARDRVVLTPHVGGVSPQSMAELRRRSVETARDYLMDGTLRHQILWTPT